MRKVREIVFSLYGIAASATLIFLIVLFSLPLLRPEYEVKKVVFLTANGEVSIEAEVADTGTKRVLGLMNRTGLEGNSGMLFVFDGEAERSFWMKSTLIPLDIIFISSGMEIVNIQKQAQPCRVFACDIYSSGKPAKYVVEVNGGFADRHGIKVGDRVGVYI